jgi:hypothetical protein
MSTYIRFKDGTEAHIIDVHTGSDVLHQYKEVGHIYERERTAVRRAIMLNRKKLYGVSRLRRKRKRIVHKRKIQTRKMPTIVTFFEDGKKRHRVIETGKVFKRIKNAIRNAIKYIQTSK